MAAESLSFRWSRLGSFGIGVLRLLGGAVTGLLAYVGEVMLLAHRTVTWVLRGEVTRRETFEQMAAVGVGGLPLVTVTVCFSGLVFGVYAVDQFKRIGASNLLGLLTAESMCREVAPVLAATVVAARSGSAIAAELATMKITEQIDALRALATDPVQHLAVPRYLALVAMLPMLALIGMVSGVAGAGVVSLLSGLSWGEFYDMIPQRLSLDTVVNGCIKSTVFGALIACSSLREGFACGYGSEAVGRATTVAVVRNIIWIHFANLMIATCTT